jgi:hypothetical protein
MLSEDTKWQYGGLPEALRGVSLPSSRSETMFRRTNTRVTMKPTNADRSITLKNLKYLMGLDWWEGFKLRELLGHNGGNGGRCMPCTSFSCGTQEPTNMPQ